MARRKSRTLTDLELEIMRVVWARQETTVDDIDTAFRNAKKPLAQPSIRTMLGILQDKGYVERRREGRGFVYQAVVPADQAQRSILKDVIDRVFDGSAGALVAALASQGMVGKDDLSKARRLIQESEQEKEK